MVYIEKCDQLAWSQILSNMASAVFASPVTVSSPGVSFSVPAAKPAITAVPPGMKICGGSHGCGKLRDAVKDFALRHFVCYYHRKPEPFDPACSRCQGGRCSKHRPSTPPESCHGCLAVPTSPSYRQPRCRNCDNLRTEATPKLPSPQGASVVYNRTSTGKQAVSVGAGQIMRLVAAIYFREQKVKQAEDVVALATKAQMPEAKRRLEAVVKWRDHTAQKVRVYIDHALTVTPYQVTTCTNCGQTPQMSCKDCGGLGTVRVAKTDPAVVDSVKRIEHFKKVLCVTELCAKVAAKGSEANDAFAQLLKSNMGLVRKFRSERQTALEQDDAEQGAMMGIRDAAVRFSPVKPECYRCVVCNHTKDLSPCDACAGTGDQGEEVCRPCQGWGVRAYGNVTCEKCGKKRMSLKTSMADFSTVAYNWAYRNSRARKETDKRSGQVKLGGKRVSSLDAITTSDEGDTISLAATGNEAGGPPTLKTEIHYEGGAGQMSMDIRNALSLVKDDQLKSVVNMMLTGLGLGEIAAKLGVNKATATKWRDKALAVMASGLEAYRNIGLAKETNDA